MVEGAEGFGPTGSDGAAQNQLEPQGSSGKY